MNTSKIYLNYQSSKLNNNIACPDLDIFCGYAIWCIVFGQLWSCIFIYGREGTNFSTKYAYIINLIYQATGECSFGFLIFTFGFLFYLNVLCNEFDYKKYIMDKTINIFIPYILFTTFFLFFIFFTSFNNMIINFTFLLRNIYFYWSFSFIPCLMVLFLISHLYITYIQLTKKYKILFFIFILNISIFLGWRYYNPILSSMFWLPFFILGITVAMNYNDIKNFRLNSKLSIFFVTIGVMLFCSLSPKFNIISGLTRNYFWSPVNNLSLISGLLFCISFLIFTNLFLSKYKLFSSYFKLLSKSKITICLVLPFFIMFFSHHPFQGYFKNINVWGVLFFDVIVTTILCLIISLTVMKLSTIARRYIPLLLD